MITYSDSSCRELSFKYQHAYSKVSDCRERKNYRSTAFLCTLCPKCAKIPVDSSPKPGMARVDVKSDKLEKKKLSDQQKFLFV